MPPTFLAQMREKYGLNKPPPAPDTEFIRRMQEKYAPPPKQEVNYDLVSSLFQKYNVPLPDYMQKYAKP